MPARLVSPTPSVLDDEGTDAPDDADLSFAGLRRRLVNLRRRKASSTNPEHVEHYQLLTAILKGQHRRTR